ncbi:unnamed protein product, partial [Brenthis ino]
MLIKLKNKNTILAGLVYWGVGKAFIYKEGARSKRQRERGVRVRVVVRVRVRVVRGRRLRLVQVQRRVNHGGVVQQAQARRAQRAPPPATAPPPPAAPPPPPPPPPTHTSATERPVSARSPTRSHTLSRVRSPCSGTGSRSRLWFMYACRASLSNKFM